MITSVHEILHIRKALGMGRPILLLLSILVFDSIDLCLVIVYQLIMIAQPHIVSGLTWMDLMRRSVGTRPHAMVTKVLSDPSHDFR